MRLDTIDSLTTYRDALGDVRGRDFRSRIAVSMGTCGIAAGTGDVLDALKTEIARRLMKAEVEVIETGCMGLCHSEPSLEVFSAKTGETVLYGNVTPAQVANIVDSLAAPTGMVEEVARTWYYPEDEADAGTMLQARVVLRNSGRINPESLDDYIGQKGYAALAKALGDLTPEAVIALVTDAGLRGRGGGGFPTGVKWRFAATRDVDEKYVICNADEGDPGAFMDRAVLEGDPHAVLEAMAIAGYAIGGHNGVIYIRAEYPLAIHRLQVAINQARDMGLLGRNILGTGFDFDIAIKFGAGAFVCGEETALIHSIEGKRGEPTVKPPFPAVEGLWHKPSIVNNVETFANVCAIVRNGADWFRSIGTERSPGTKVFALAGKISSVGLIEVPMGTTLRQIIYDIGGGIRDGKAFKAVQTGGPSGGCIREDNLDTPIDYDSLMALGSMMGSGGMIVMDEDDCMVNIAKFFLDFTLDESCGKCTPCRVGNKRLHEMLTRICEGTAEPGILRDLEDLSVTVKDTSLCGLGQTSPNPVLSTMALFTDEYAAHIHEQRCPAGVCAKLIRYVITDSCVGCTLCARNCPVACISGERRELHVIDQDACIHCGVCREVCKFHAVERQ